MNKLLVVCLSVALVGCGKKEPLFKGKPASAWRQALQDPDPPTRRQAAEALAALKTTDAVPELIAALQDRDRLVRARAAEALWSLGTRGKEAVPALIPLLKDPAPEVRINAAGALGDIGSGAEAAI